MQYEESRLSKPNVNLRSLRRIFEFPFQPDTRPYFEGLLIYAFQRGLLKERNLFEIKYSDKYYEYVGFEFGGGIVEISFACYFLKRMPKLFFLEKYREELGFPNFQEFSINEISGLIIDSTIDFFSGKILNFLVLNCLPFSIELSIDGNTLLKLLEGTPVPTRKVAFSDKEKGVLTVERCYLNQVLTFSVPFPRDFTFPYECGVDIDPGLFFKILFCCKGGTVGMVPSSSNGLGA